MKPEVEAAIAQIKAEFVGHPVDIAPDSNGGSYVTVHNLAIGDQYSPSISWVKFQVSFQYPFADVYPHFIDGSVHRVDGQRWGAGLSPTTWQNQSVIQISRRSNRLNPTVDNAATKLAKVLEWLRSQ